MVFGQQDYHNAKRHRHFNLGYHNYGRLCYSIGKFNVYQCYGYGK